MTVFKFKPVFFLALYSAMFNFATPAFAQQWARVEGLPEVQITALYSNGGDSLYAAGPTKIYFTFNGGMSWDSSAVLSPTLDDYITDITQLKGRLFASTINDGIFYSSNGGFNFYQDNIGLSGTGAHSVSMLAVRGDSIYAATYGAGVFVKKKDPAAIWLSYNAGLPWGTVESIVADGNNLIAGAGANARLSMRSTSEAVWTETPFADFNGNINSFLGAVRHDDVLLGAGMNGFYRSEDDGETWTYFNPGFGFTSSAGFVRDGNRTYALLNKSGLKAALFYTNDKGETWVPFQPVPRGTVGYDIALCAKTLYAAHGDGLWYLQTVTDVPERPVAAKPSFEQIFPNPASDEAKVKFTLPQASLATLTLYDGQGNLVRNLHQAELPSGTHNLEVSISDLPSGMYYCTLTTAQGRAVKALTVMH